MKSLALALILFSPAAFAGTPINLGTPYTINLTPPVSVTGCYAGAVTTIGYKTVVTGFSADGNYALGQVAAWFTCGHSGRGSTVHTVWSCAQLRWDLSGNLVDTTVNVARGAGNQPVSSYCPTETLEFPSTTPPSTRVVGNEFTNAGGYVAETVLAEACGSIACYATYYYPTLVTP
jgi:hypothetical protein